MPAQASDTAPYWEAARRHELLLPRCRACDGRWSPPGAACPRCGALDFEWAPVCGRGEVVTYTVVHRAPSPAFAARVPYLLAVVQLAEGPRLLTNVVDCAPEEARIGLPVEVTFEEHADGVVPQFRPRREKE